MAAARGARVRRGWAALIGAVIASSTVKIAVADDPPKRPLPDYEGRPPPPSTPGEIALWVPRILFSPLYFTSEFLIRRPLGALLTAAERANIPTVLYDFFAFGPDHKAGFAPIVFGDFGFNPSVGVFLFWNDAFFKGNDLQLHASAWSNDWIAGSVGERIHFHGKGTVGWQLVGIRRPDHVFYGIGPRTVQSNQSRYGADNVDGSITADFPMWRSSKVEAGAGVRHSNFYDGHFGHDPGIVQEAAAGVFPLPDGFAHGYTAEYNRVLVALDSRRPYPAEGSGFRLEAQVAQGNDVSVSPGSGWLKYEAAAGGFLDVDQKRRILSLSVMAMFADPLGVRPVPFTELVSLGGDAPMPGFYPGRMVDRSAAVASLRYRWPIGPWIDGSMQFATGNVFDDHLSGFDPKLFRLSAALGIESDEAPDNNLQLLIGFGSETFESGAKIDTFRLMVGTSRGL
jgi:hypothetical protein